MPAAMTAAKVMSTAGLLLGMSFAAARPGMPGDSSGAMRLSLAERRLVSERQVWQALKPVLARAHT